MILFLQTAVAFGQDMGKVVAPSERQAYLGAFADFGGTESEVTTEKIEAYSRLIGKKIAWAYFGNNWLDGRIVFPQAAVEACLQAGVIPYIRFSPYHMGASPRFRKKSFGKLE